MTEDLPTEAVKAKVSFRFDKGLCNYISSDLYDHFASSESSDNNEHSNDKSVLVSVQLPGYEAHQSSKLVRCTLDKNLKLA